jgi:hypothetical protein
VLPTVLAVTGTARRHRRIAQRPIHGASFAASFDDRGSERA